MATTHETEQTRVRTLNVDEARRSFDAEARVYLRMSGNEFIAKWDAGTFENPDDPDVMRVALLLPLIR